MTTATAGLLALGFVSHVQSSGLRAAFVGGEQAAPPTISKLLHVFAAFAGTWFVAPKAVQAIKRWRPDVNLLTIVAVAGTIGLGDYLEAARAELLPDDKVSAIKEFGARYGHIATVGDGVNDAPTMALAGLGIAMGVSGSDAALVRDDLAMVSWRIQHSRRTLAVIRQNIGFSLGIKAACLVLTVIGHASRWAAIAADIGASLLVIFNGLRLLRALGTIVPAQKSGPPCRLIPRSREGFIRAIADGYSMTKKTRRANARLRTYRRDMADA